MRPHNSIPKGSFTDKMPEGNPERPKLDLSLVYMAPYILLDYFRAGSIESGTTLDLGVWGCTPKLGTLNQYPHFHRVPQDSVPDDIKDCVSLVTGWHRWHSQEMSVP